MFGDPFYHGTLRKTVVAFGSLFNSLYVTRTQDNNPVKIKVPIIYSAKEKFIQRYADTFNRDNNDTIATQIILPQMGFEIGEISYDAARKKPTVNKRIVERTVGGDTSYAVNYAEVPYNVNFNLTAYVRYMDDGLQIAEQILPYFTPDFTVAIKQSVLGETGERMNIPFVLNSVGVGSDYEGSMEAGSSRMILWDFSFTARINLFGPVSSSGIILDIDNNFFISPAEVDDVVTTPVTPDEPISSTTSASVGKINILATETTAGAGEYTITETSTVGL
jgi:hypothetical protein